MLDLNGGAHGIGVQAWTTYFRTIGGSADGSFAWYKGGVHAHNQFDAGGGEVLMRLNSAALSVNGEIQWGSASRLSVNQSGSIELGDSTQVGVIPFIDFHYGVGAAQDFNVRLINDANGQLTCEGNFRATTLTETSDRNAKENIQPVESRAVLEKVVALPVSQWNFKRQPQVALTGLERSAMADGAVPALSELVI